MVVFYTVVKVLIVDYKVLAVVPNHSVDHHMATDVVVAVVLRVVVVVVQVDHLAWVLLAVVVLQHPLVVVPAFVEVAAVVVAVVVAVAVDHSYSYTCVVVVEDAKIVTKNLGSA